MLLAVACVWGSPITINVPGTANPWLAGAPNGTTDPPGAPPPTPFDQAPAQSPAQVLGLTISPTMLLHFGAFGSVAFGPTSAPAGPDGRVYAGQSAIPHAFGFVNGIGNSILPVESLVGIFLDNSSPIGQADPGTLDFTLQASRDYLLLAPGLRQPFFIGDGATSLGAAQYIQAPAGATRLFLGTMDGSDWENNVGSFTVTVDVVPEPAAMALTALGILSVWVFRRKLVPCQARGMESK